MVHAVETISANAQKKNPPKVTPEPPSIVNASRGRIDELKIKHGEALPGQEHAAEVIAEHVNIEGKIVPEHIRSLHRFKGSADKATLISDLKAKLADLDWWRIKYHICRHDEGLPRDEWITDSEYGSVPGEV